MNKISLLIKMTKPEKHNLQKIATRFGYNLSEYIKRKLFNENNDLEAQEIRYFSPSNDKHNLLNVSILYKSFYLIKEILSKQGYSQHEILALEKKSLEYAREQREKQGYKVMENNHE